MSITHHASDTLLLDYAAGRLSPAPALVLSSHLAMSSKSQQKLGQFERLGGALLEEQPMAQVSTDLFDRMLAQLDTPVRPDPISVGHDLRYLDLGMRAPQPLAERRISKWRWIAPGMRFAKVDVPEDPIYNVVLLRIGAGKSLPMHGHTGTELTLVLKGAFSDEGGRYGPGDLEEEDGDTDHQPKVEKDSECICLAAIEGSMTPHGLIARMMQPFIGI
jgi:putative transcriptional regulator